MAPFTLEELQGQYDNFKRVSDHCAQTADYNAFADLFTDDCLYIEHVFGEMHGREAVRRWIVPLMSTYPNTKMVKYTHDWVYFDACTAEMVFCARTHMADLGDGMDYTATNWTRLKYAGDGLFSLEEDIYNPASAAVENVEMPTAVFGQVVCGLTRAIRARSLCSSRVPTYRSSQLVNVRSSAAGSGKPSRTTTERIRSATR